MIAIGGYTPQYIDLWVAKYKGFFAKAGVDVDIDGFGTQLLPTFLSGRADLVEAGVSSVLPFTAQGKDLKIIYQTSPGNPYGFVVKKSANINTATDLAGKSIATFGAGGSIGIANALSKYIVSKGAQPPKIVSAVAPTGSFSPLVVSGTYATTMVDRAQVTPFLDDQKLKFIPDLVPHSPIMQALLPSDSPGSSLVGEQSRLVQKKAAIVALLAGMRAADRWMLTASDKEIADAALQDPDFAKQYPEAALIKGVAALRPILPMKAEGLVSEAGWNAGLKAWADWKTGVDLTSSMFTYGNRVDMSYRDAAAPLADKISTGS